MRRSRREVEDRVRDPEGSARLLGLMAVFALPPLRTSAGGWRPVRIEVCTPNGWRLADMFALTDTAVVVVCGRTEYVFPVRHPPRWRYVA
jgi:hypothetical protein